MTGTVNFLIVDDLEENLLALEGLLRRDGLTFLRARSGEEALEILLRHDVALALLDVQMPGMDGFELAEFMRGSERTRHIPIIFLTAGSTDVQRRFRGYEAGAVDVIQKPIEADALRSKANVFFDLHRQRQQILTQLAELAHYAETLRTINQNRDRFIAVLGHELRNPVMALNAGLHLLKRRTDPEDREAIRVRMERQTSHLARLIEDLLDISRIDQGKISLKRETASLRDIVRAAIELSQPLIDAHAHTLDAGTCPGDIAVQGDRIRLAQAISNLLNNAARYTPQGGRITLGVRIADAVAEIAVSDNGIGIPADMHTKIFQAFVQGDDGGLGSGGLGIGLALVKQLVELHGGTIAVASEGAGQGACFTIRLPITGSSSIAGAPA